MVAVILALPCLALSTGQLHTFSRRGALVAAGGAALGAALPAHAVEEEDVKVYFGAGCFWHVQHEFVLKEAAELGRSGAAFSAVTGYAGGTGTERGLVCYHNGRGVSDYGRLGHAEAVQVGPAPSLAMTVAVRMPTTAALLCAGFDPAERPASVCEQVHRHLRQPWLPPRPSGEREGAGRGWVGCGIGWRVGSGEE